MSSSGDGPSLLYLTCLYEKYMRYTSDTHTVSFSFFLPVSGRREKRWKKDGIHVMYTKIQIIKGIMYPFRWESTHITCLFSFSFFFLSFRQLKASFLYSIYYIYSLRFASALSWCFTSSSLSRMWLNSFYMQSVWEAAWHTKETDESHWDFIFFFFFVFFKDIVIYHRETRNQIEPSPPAQKKKKLIRQLTLYTDDWFFFLKKQRIIHGLVVWMNELCTYRRFQVFEATEFIYLFFFFIYLHINSGPPVLKGSSLYLSGHVFKI